MPYNHAGEIGDVWKHLPLCDILTDNSIYMSPVTHDINAGFSGHVGAVVTPLLYSIKG